MNMADKFRLLIKQREINRLKAELKEARSHILYLRKIMHDDIREIARDMRALPAPNDLDLDLDLNT